MAQRDGILKSVDEDMQAFLKKQSQEAFRMKMPWRKRLMRNWSVF